MSDSWDLKMIPSGPASDYGREPQRPLTSMAAVLPVLPAGPLLPPRECALVLVDLKGQCMVLVHLFKGTFPLYPCLIMGVSVQFPVHINGSDLGFLLP